MPEASQLTPRQKAQALAGMLLAMFLAALDQTVVATAGPDMQRTLNIDASLYTWITTGYLVSSTVLVPVYGKLSDIYGRKRIVVFGVVLFLVASALCGLSENTAQLIAFRVLQGAGSASLFTSAFAVVADLFPPSERGKYSGLFGAVFGVSSLVGPLLGGFITDTFGWHWVFFINLPIGALALTFILLYMPPLIPRLDRKPSIDVAGAVLLGLGVVPLLIALTLGRPELRPGEHGYLWSDWQVLCLFGVGVVGLVSFVTWELRIADPLVELRMFKNPTVMFGIATVFVMGGAFLTPMVFLPLFMVNVVGVSATASGLTISPLVLGVVAGNVLSGQLVSRIGKYKPLMLGALVLAITGFAILALTLTSSSTQGEVTVKMVLLGLGLGPTIPLYTIAIQNAVTPAQLGLSTSMVTFFRQMGSTVGIAIVGSLFATTLSHELSWRLGEATSGLPPELVARFSGAPGGEEGGAPPRFEPEKVKAKISEQLEGALKLAARALDGEMIASQLIAASPFANAELKAAAEAGGIRPQVRARYTVTRSKLRSAAQGDGSWEELRTSAGVGLPPQRPLDEAALNRLDLQLETAGAQAADAASVRALASVRAELDARKPQLFAAVDAAGAAVKEAFTQSILVVYRVALILAVLAFLLTLRLPQLPLHTSMGGPPTSERGDVVLASLMTLQPDETSPERKQTDESLKAEREKVDSALAENLAAFDEIADAVITRARLRADTVLAAARAKTDRQSSTNTSPGGLVPVSLAKERGREDKQLEEERANADEILKEERAEHVVLLAHERKETDKDLVRERGHADDALATRDEFLSIVSHDLRALLNQVMGFAGLITMEVSRSQYGKEVIKDAERIQRSGSRMNRLIGDLVDVASIHAGTLAVSRQHEDPAQTVLEAVDTFQAQAKARGITVTSELVPPALSIEFDPARILQVLTNLLSNAIKFTPLNGKVVVRVERVGPDVCFTVSDTGLGIPADKLEAVFERYLQIDTHDRRGVGLGLYISKCIVLGHGGRIWAESKIGVGSTFRFTLPVQRPTA